MRGLSIKDRLLGPSLSTRGLGSFNLLAFFQLYVKGLQETF